MSKKRISVVGYGGQGSWHTREILGSDTWELAGIWDIDAARRDIAAANGIYVYPCFEAVLADPSIDAVTVATPNDTHPQIVKDLLYAGKNVVCEKPVAITVAEFDEMVQVAKETGKIFTVHQNRRFDIDHLAMKGLVQSGEIGKLLHIESRVHGSRGIPSDWRGTKEHGGGIILDWGVHLIDQLLTYIGGTVTEVACDCTHITNTEVDDGFTLRLKFSGGETATVEVMTYNFIALPRFYMQCEKGTAVIYHWDTPAHVAKMKVWNEREILPAQTAAGITKTMTRRDEQTLDEYDIPIPQTDRHDFYRNLSHAIDGTEELMVTLPQVRRVMLVMEAAFEADKARKILVTNI